MKAILLVAGYATRLYPLTKTMPKALLNIGGKPILTYIYEQIETLDAVDEVFVVSNHKFYDHFVQWADTLNGSKAITVIDDGTTNEDNRRGAIGDIKFTIDQKKINDDIVVVAGDNFFTYKLKDMYDYYASVKDDCVCVKEIDDIEELKAFAVANLDENNKITQLEEKPQQPKSNTAVFATYMYTKDTIQLFEKYLSEGNKPDAPGYFVEWLYRKKPVYAYKFQGECYDIGTPESYEEVGNLYKA
jgi:glucose-1-phosphate thymidylyltransferase